MKRNRFSVAWRKAPTGALAISFLLFSIWSASPAAALLLGVDVSPPQPSKCDSVSIGVSGILHSSCYQIVGAQIRGPEYPPCLLPGPCPARFVVEITVRWPIGDVCTAASAPYSRTFNVGKLTAGEYRVAARERVITFLPDSTDSTVAESFANTAFTVRQDFSCPTPSCYMLGLHGESRCDAVVRPGGTGCLDLTLTNSGAVGGVQTTLEASSENPVMSPGSFLHAVSAEAIGRAAGFEVGWSIEGSNTKLILFSPRGGTIPPGSGPIARICYAVADQTPPGQRFLVHDTATIVADPEGNSIPPCPTLVFARIAPGIICVEPTACDVNADGRSNLLDIIRLVRCALGSRTDSLPACPDSIAARADCNADGSVDIRDVICCVRKIVETVVTFPNPFLPRPIGGVLAGESAIGFEGTARWNSAFDGVATVRIDANENWGGTQFVINTRETPVRIRSLSLDDASARAGIRLEFAVNELGIAHVMLLETTPGVRPAHTYRILVRLERAPSGSGSAPLRIQDVLAGTSEGDEAPISTANTWLLIDEAAVAAPILLGARPNPTSSATEIGFALPADGAATLRVYDVAGRLVRTLAEGPTTAGVHRARWDGLDARGRVVRSGIYFAKLTAGTTIRSERILLLR